MTYILDFIQNQENFKLILLSGIVFIGLFIIKSYFTKKILNNDSLKNIERIRYAKSVSNQFHVILFICLIAIWFSQIQSVLISMLAVAAALVLATKELIMSLLGGLLEKTNSYFNIGDRIEVDDIRGFVVEKNIFTTKILEIGPDKNSQQTTGSMINIPNSIFLTKSCKNDSYFKGYSIKTYYFLIPNYEIVNEVEEKVLSWGKEICKDYLEEASSYIHKFCQKENLIIPSIDARSKVVLNEDNKVTVLLKIPVRNDLIADIEQKLNRQFIDILKKIPQSEVEKNK